VLCWTRRQYLDTSYCRVAPARLSVGLGISLLRANQSLGRRLEQPGSICIAVGLTPLSCSVSVLVSSHLLASMWFPVSMSVLGLAISLALAWVGHEAVVVGSPLAALAHLTASHLCESRPLDWSHWCPHSLSLSGPGSSRPPLFWLWPWCACSTVSHPGITRPESPLLPLTTLSFLAPVLSALRLGPLAYLLCLRWFSAANLVHRLTA